MTTLHNWPTHLVPPWARYASQVSRNIFYRLKRVGILYPKVNRSKNISRESAELYQQYRPGSRDVRDVRTVDLEVLYGKEGIQLGGACEMRSSWKFNELKPRFYYAQGGRDYFASRYIKKFAIALMESVSSTEVKKRRNPDYFVEADPDDYLITWDLTAFTSTLYELRFFLYWVARGIEDQGDVAIELFDYKDGLVWTTASRMFDDYNETVNINSPFSIHRIIDKFCLQEDFDQPFFEQQNSGMLGVGGNIGFSTANHGFAIDQVSEVGKSVSAGDDAFNARKDNPFDTLFPHIKKIGHLHPEKCSIIPPGEDGPMKFLKRRLERTETGFWLDFLINLPLPCLVDERYGGRTPPDMSDFDRAKKIATTVGQVVWKITTYFDELDSQDILLLSAYLQMIYRVFNFNLRGGLPGHIFTVKGNRYTGMFAYPPVDFKYFDPRGKDWLEFLLDQPLDAPISIPRMVPYFRPSPVSKGERFLGIRERHWSALEDLGYVKEVGMVTEMVTYIGEKNKRRLMSFIKHDYRDYHPLYEFDLVEELPLHFSFVYAPDISGGYRSIVEAL